LFTGLLYTERLQPEAMRLQNHGLGLEKTGEKANLGHRMACTINKIGIVLETLRGCSRDSCEPKILQPEAIRLQNHGPGLEQTGEKANSCHRMACSTINKMGIVLETQGRFVLDFGMCYSPYITYFQKTHRV
jgi:hypothetical protein